MLTFHQKNEIIHIICPLCENGIKIRGNSFEIQYLFENLVKCSCQKFSCFIMNKGDEFTLWQDCLILETSNKILHVYCNYEDEITSIFYDWGNASLEIKTIIPHAKIIKNIEKYIKLI